MSPITLLQPRRIAFGSGCSLDCAHDLEASGLRRAFLVTSPPVLAHAEPLAGALRAAGLVVEIYPRVAAEPTLASLAEALAAARAFRPDAVLGLGGGSALDVSKLVSALHDSEQDVHRAFGVNLLAGRRTFLACLPTTSGTGSEVSPNAVLLDEEERLKRTVSSSHLVPDAAYIDPALTVSVPPAVTTATGLDALTHQMVDTYALQGVRLIGANLARVVADGSDLQAREALALASLYGGLCLGPVGVGAVHALAYPLGGEFHVSHGVSNALLLPHVMEYNLPAMPERYAEVALALGADSAATATETARRGVAVVRDLSLRCAIVGRLSELGVPESAIPRMAEAAVKIARLMKNNPRPMTAADAEAVYRAAY